MQKEENQKILLVLSCSLDVTDSTNDLYSLYGDSSSSESFRQSSLWLSFLIETK